jgi:hypothetical protein
VKKSVIADLKDMEGQYFKWTMWALERFRGGETLTFSIAVKKVNSPFKIKYEWTFKL